VALRVRTRDVAAVWASGLRRRDGQRPAVLAAAPGVVEEHVVWLATAEQLAVLDRCEGRDDRFRLARLRTGEVHTADGVRIVEPWCYVGHGAIRRPLLVNGAPVRCADLPQEAALGLTGEPGDDGLDAPTVAGAPHGDEWPAALFVYGLLQPGEPSWPLVAPHAAGEPRRASVRGVVYDTGLGYPGLHRGTGGGDAPGWLVPVRDPAALLPTLDEFEGAQYRRERVVTADGTVCWSYVWADAFEGLRPLPAGWRQAG
jgi:gamma-glutamylcyclotransferase (GGCT)/AIG2-like uncharacterized protein YtfP